jgi:hypothetical protein
MRGAVVFVLVGATALVAYNIGRQETTTSRSTPVGQQTSFARPVALAAPVESLPTVPVTSASVSTVTPAEAKPTARDKALDKKRIGEAVLTAAAIAAIIVKTSRDQYYATGHPCACPDDLMRNGRACGGRSAYSRPGGAAPLCYPTDITAAMIESYRQTAAR